MSLYTFEPGSDVREWQERRETFLNIAFAR